MTTDPFLAELGADWRRQNTAVDHIQAHIRKRQRRTGLALAAKSAGIAIALLAAVWFVSMALDGAPAIFALAGIVMLVALPLMGLEIAATARSLWIASSDTPSSQLSRARDQAAAARRLLWASRAASLLLGASALALMMLYWVGLARREDALLFVPLWGLFALGGWVWQRHRRRMLSAEIARCDSLLAEFGEADGPVTR